MRLNRPAVQVALAKVQHEHREVHWQKCEQFFSGPRLTYVNLFVKLNKIPNCSTPNMA